MLDSRAEDLSYWLQSEDNITNPFKESAMFTGKIAKSAGT